MAEDNLAENLEQEISELTAVADGEEAQSAGGTDDGSGADSGDNGGPANSVIRDRNLELILDIPLKVSVELGRTKMIVSELLNLGQGSVIELQKLAGEPMEVLVNDKVVAKGEAVVVNEKFGVRLTDIVSQAERVEQLND
jgi:flagellar motor switch protein FliN/FliY